MDILFRDQNGNTLSVNGFAPAPVHLCAHRATLFDVEASRLEGWGAKLSDDGETLIVTLDLKEA